MTRALSPTLGLLLLAPAVLLANGGRLRVAEAPIGDYRVSVFTSPTPIPPDTLDVSVLVTEVGRNRPVEGLEVEVALTPIDHQAPAWSRTATREAADDPRYYSAKFRPGGSGRWGVSVSVSGPGGTGEVSFEIEAREGGVLGSPAVVLLLSLLPLAILAWWLLRPGPPQCDGDHADTERPLGEGAATEPPGSVGE